LSIDIEDLQQMTYSCRKRLTLELYCAIINTSKETNQNTGEIEMSAVSKLMNELRKVETEKLLDLLNVETTGMDQQMLQTAQMVKRAIQGVLDER